MTRQGTTGGPCPCTPRWRAYSMLPVARPRRSSSRFNRASAPRHQPQHDNGKVPKQQNEKNAKRYEEEYNRDLKYRRNPSLVPYEGRARRTFYSARHSHHYQGQEAEHAYKDRRSRVCPGVVKKQKEGRSRCPKLNGCDLYVCRITKNGEFGCSKPCWRCVDWCAWAGIRRIFHWSTEEGRFICLKVGDAWQEGCYETIADVRFLKARASVKL